MRTVPDRLDEAATPAVPDPRLERIVAAVDFAEPSRRAVSWIARHLAPAAELVLVHAVCVPEPPPFIGQSRSAREQLLESIRRGADVRMRELVPTLGMARARHEIRDGAPHAVIEAVADACDADLVVVGDHGARSGLSALSGTTAQRVVRVARRPVLLARALSEHAPRRVLAAVDGSPDTDAVLAWAATLGARLGAEVELLHVLNPLAVGAVGVGASEAESRRALDQVREAASRWLEAKARACRASAASAATAATVATRLGSGEPALEIVAEARRADADLVVMGRGATARVVRALLGSTTEHVLRHGERSVLVVGGS